MPKPDHREEIEVKLRVPDVAALRARLKRLCAREISPRTYEFNTLYDTSKSSLRRRGQLIRIRIEHPAKRFGKIHAIENAPAILTYKGPAPPLRSTVKSGALSKIRTHFKIKDEAEVSLAGANQMARILRALELYPVFRYAKFRTTHLFPGIRGLKIELDETPVGIYLELEGPVRAIDRGARLLGYCREDYLKETYGSLYLADCRRRGRKPGDMLFPPTKKLQ
jgi:adenylate cyclase, class 2